MKTIRSQLSHSTQFGKNWRRTKPTLKPDYIVGLTDGEGCFYVQIRTSKRYRYSVSSHKDILSKIIPFFRDYQLQSSSKQKNFKLFCQIASLIEQKAHLTVCGLAKIKKIKAKMNHTGVGLA